MITQKIYNDIFPMQHTDITCSVLVSGFMGWIELQKYFFLALLRFSVSCNENIDFFLINLETIAIRFINNAHR